MIRIRMLLLVLVVGLSPITARLITARSSSMLNHLGSYGGTTAAVAIDGQHAYVGEGLGLTVMDISNADQPVVVGRTTPFTVLDEIVASEGYVYAASAFTGDLWVVDVSDPTAPVAVSSVPSNRIFSLSTDGSYLYAGVFGDGLFIYDLANPAALQEVGYLDTGAFPQTVVSQGNLVFVADLNGGVVIVDASNPANPVELTRIPISSPDQTIAVAVAGDYLYTEYGQQFRVFDISDPANPIEVGSVYLFAGALFIDLSGNIAYVGGRVTRVATIDIANPLDPQVVTEYHTGEWIDDLTSTGNYLYIVEEESGIWVYDVSDPADLTLASRYPVVTQIVAVAASGDYAYLADQRKGFEVVDISDPALPQPIGFYEASFFGVDNLTVVGDYIFLAAGFDGLRVVDVSDPTNPTEVGYYDAQSLVNDVAIQNDYAYLASQFGDFTILDVSDPANPTEVATYVFGGGTSIEVAGNRAYIVDDENGLLVLNIANPQTVTEMGGFDPGNNSALDIAVMGDYALLAVENSFVQVLDVSVPNNIQSIGEFPTKPHSVAVVGNQVYIGGITTAGHLSFKVVDFSNPAAPVLVDSVDYLNGSFSSKVYLDGDIAFLASPNNGMLIYATTLIAPGDERVYLPLVRG